MEKDLPVQAIKGLLRRPGPPREIWDEALRRSGIPPDQIAEYNVPDAVSIEDMNKAIREQGCANSIAQPNSKHSDDQSQSDVPRRED